MTTMTITIERTPRTVQLGTATLQTEELSVSLPFARKPCDLSELGGGTPSKVLVTETREMSTTEFDEFAANLLRSRTWLNGRGGHLCAGFSGQPAAGDVRHALYEPIHHCSALCAVLPDWPSTAWRPLQFCRATQLRSNYFRRLDQRYAGLDAPCRQTTGLGTGCSGCCSGRARLRGDQSRLAHLSDPRLAATQTQVLKRETSVLKFSAN